MLPLARYALLASLLALPACRREDHGQARVQEKAAASPSTQRELLPTLRVSELLAPGAELKPSPRAASLAGARVRLVGFIAELEVPPENALYLVPQPIHCDEAGGGTADLPPEAVLVALPASMQPRREHTPQPVEAVGVLGVGNHSDGQGRVANFRLRLSAPELKAL
jgi:hypothetical protein